MNRDTKFQTEIESDSYYDAVLRSVGIVQSNSPPPLCILTFAMLNTLAITAK